jgi:hypothetical protein
VRGTFYKPRFRAVNVFGFAVVLRDVFIHRDITKIGRDWSLESVYRTRQKEGLARNSKHLQRGI